MIELTIKIKNDGKFCGNCKFQDFTEDHNGVQCYLFNEFLSDDVNADPIKRCKKCLKYEKTRNVL